ncbi:MAG: DUF2520 domain-containing protein [Prevotella sp.]|jgi:predicted short-subunit dehydrogenase-like oxidoreductase (DUF2520 family)|nr:DUF2520 domain-containing protein [Prevotella sp.]
MKIVLIGRGRLATNLERALLAAGHEVASINSRTLEGLSREADIFIIAVKDSALQDVVREATKGREDQLFVHTAGSMSLNVFEGCTTRYGVFYPMQTFSKEHQADFSVIPFFLEANGSEALATLHALASSISGNVYELTTEERKQLHLAAVFACNFANHCYDMAATLLERHGLSFTVLLPLIDETARKVHDLHPRLAQTGPAVRYDENVIGIQSNLLAEQSDLQRIYLLMSQHIYEYATQPTINKE